MRRSVILSLLLCPVAAHAQSAQGDVSVTIYNDDLALVRDVRRLDLPRGRSRQELADVSARIRPETVSLAGDGIAIVEQNFDFDLLTPGKLMEKAVGQMVTIVRTNPGNGAETREQAKVLAVNGGVVLQIGPRIEVLRDDGLPVRVIFDHVPETLRARPTLSVTLETARGGPRAAALSYLTPGLGWAADYVALFDERGGRIDVQGWVTLTNSSGASYADANTLLVAGRVARADGDDANDYRPRPRSLQRPGAQTAARERLGDFYLYPLAERTTIADRQTKQVSFLNVAGAPARKAYEYRVGWLNGLDTAASADTVLKFSTARDGGLGDALPAGTVRVYMKDARGAAQFVGENRIDHTPMGSELSIKTGEAFDVKVKPVVEKRERITRDEWERTARYRVTTPSGSRIVTVEENPIFWRTTMRYVVTNARPAPVTVELSQAGLDDYWEDTRVVSESVKGEQRSRDVRSWQVSAPANGETTLTVVIDTRY